MFVFTDKIWYKFQFCSFLFVFFGSKISFPFADSNLSKFYECLFMLGKLCVYRETVLHGGREQRLGSLPSVNTVFCNYSINVY